MIALDKGSKFGALRWTIERGACLLRLFASVGTAWVKPFVGECPGRLARCR